MEDPLSRMNDCNNTCDVTWCIVGSVDAVSLYPSIDVDFEVEKCVEIISKSEMEFQNVNTVELGLLLGLGYDNECFDEYNPRGF